MRDWPKLVSARSKPERIYIRFGRWGGRSLNFSTHEEEPGISVYPAVWDGDVVIPDWDFTMRELEALSGRCVWAVTGLEAGTGSDGEPVLRRVTARPYAIRKTW